MWQRRAAALRRKRLWGAMVFCVCACLAAAWGNALYRLARVHDGGAGGGDRRAMRADVRATRADTARRELEDRVSAVLEDAMEQATSPYAASSAASSGPSGTAEETDLLLRLPHGVLEGFSIVCSAACSRECRRRGNVDKSDLSALVITCDCLDVFDELRLVSQDTPRAHAAAAQHAAWADVTNVSFIKQQRTLALCTRLTQCLAHEPGPSGAAGAGGGKAAPCAARAAEILEAGLKHISDTSSTKGELTRVGAAPLKRLFDFVGSTLYGEHSTRNLELILATALADYSAELGHSARAEGAEIPGYFVDLGCGRGKMVAAACALPAFSELFSKCFGYEIVSHRVQVARCPPLPPPESSNKFARGVCHAHIHLVSHAV